VTEANRSQLEELQKLLEIREALTLHLEKLEEKKALARPEIVEKVQKDYLARLAHVERDLKQSGALQTALTQLEKEMAATSGRIAVLRDEEEEASVRYMVGEFDENAFRSLEAEKQAERAEQEGKLASLKEKALFYRGLLEGEPRRGPEAGKGYEFLPSLEEPAATTDLRPEKRAEPTDGLKCPQCGTSNPSDNWFCEKCGKELVDVQKFLPGGKP